MIGSATAPAGLTACDLEPIHIPGSIQPHGFLLVAEAGSLRVVGAAGDVEARLTPDWLGADLPTLLGCDPQVLRRCIGEPTVRLDPVAGPGGMFDVLVHSAGDALIVAMEEAPPIRMSAADILARLYGAAGRLERADDLPTLWRAAAQAFRQLTGYGRVMIYRFLEDGSGSVIGEDRAPQMRSFLNHRFPAEDIPRQARALYVRNRVRVIPDVAYVPAPLRPAEPRLAQLDLSDVELRSVSPVHIQYLRNMGVAASASVSIVKDGQLWGLVACHDHEPRHLPHETRLACQMLAADLARQIALREETAQYRERMRLRLVEESLVARLSAETPLDAVMSAHGSEICAALDADGFAIVSATATHGVGNAPAPADLRRLAGLIGERVPLRAFATHTLPETLPEAADLAALASGVLAVSIPGDEPMQLLWFRAEHVQVIEWAGNPHKASGDDPNAILTPRASFEAWRQTVRGQSRPWSPAEIDTASRVARGLLETRQNRRIRDLNAKLSATIVENDRLLEHKDYLMREVNHRVQNSLQLVAAFLRLQARLAGEEATVHLAEAERRVAAVALVHRQLHGGDNIENVDLARYLTDLCDEIVASMGGDWRDVMQRDFAPVLVAANRAVQLGLILTELVINTAKYAYSGKPGPIAISLGQQGGRLLLVVRDRGAGHSGQRQGFGTMMLNAMAQSLGGSIDYEDNAPGLRARVVAPLAAD
ncbi:histidine kinase dimerization/phosphoacceptor domain -containing protein [Ancylobacter terrae]|uniref:histidine kinase dimerization/phosphoacceptor domain -containing protein n=1 Tax=Ancylobacter sp. sgz301288 TaxID=3342077 RepID=UPI00385E600E